MLMVCIPSNVKCKSDPHGFGVGLVPQLEELGEDGGGHRREGAVRDEVKSDDQNVHLRVSRMTPEPDDLDKCC